MKPLLGKIASFRRLPAFAKLWFLPVWVILGVAKAVIFIVPFKHVCGWLGTHEGIAARSLLLDPSQEARARAVGRVVRLTAPYAPWNANCFPQAIAARLLLGLYGVPQLIYFGLIHDPSTRELKAHAWVTAGRVAVTGGHCFANYTVVGIFASKGRDRDRRRSIQGVATARTS